MRRVKPSVANAFFDDWIYTKGSPHVRIIKQVHAGNGPYHLQIHTQQSHRFEQHLSKHLPIEIFFYQDRKHWVKQVIEINSEHDSFDFTLPFKPVYVTLDAEEKLSDAKWCIRFARDLFEINHTFL